MKRIVAATFTRTAKRLLVLMAVLAAMLVAAVPAFAQEQDSVTGDDPEQDFYSTLTFELKAEGEPPAGTEFFGAVSGEGGSASCRSRTRTATAPTPAARRFLSTCRGPGRVQNGYP